LFEELGVPVLEVPRDPPGLHRHRELVRFDRGHRLAVFVPEVLLELFVLRRGLGAERSPGLADDHAEVLRRDVVVLRELAEVLDAYVVLALLDVSDALLDVPTCRWRSRLRETPAARRAARGATGASAPTLLLLAFSPAGRTAAFVFLEDH
jgi:hypothetical protein